MVPNVNWFMSVPVLENGSAGVANAELKPGSFVPCERNAMCSQSYQTVRKCIIPAMDITQAQSKSLSLRVRDYSLQNAM